jgi:hypothetical protein
MTAPLFPACPELRTHVPQRVVDALAADGYRVHRVGRAAYIHGPVCSGATPDRQGALLDARRPTFHLIFGVWPTGAVAPSWAGRLGVPSGGYLRRARRLDLEHRGRAYLRDRRGRFLVRLPWYRIPPVQVHSFEPAGLSLVDAEELRAAERRAELRNRGYWA